VLGAEFSQQHKLLQHPKKAYLLFLDHPAYKIPYTPKLPTASTYIVPKERSLIGLQKTAQYCPMCVCAAAASNISSLLPQGPAYRVRRCVSPVCMGGMPPGRSISSRWPRRGCSSCCQAGWPLAADSSCPLHTPAATTTPCRARTLAHRSAHSSQHTTGRAQDDQV